MLLRPATAWLPIWSDDRTTLTISPTAPLQPNTGYTLTLDTQALSQRFRALDQPFTLHFRTAPAPAVVRVLPTDGAADVPLEAPISIRFSRMIVPADALMQPAALPRAAFRAAAGRQRDLARSGDGAIPPDRAAAPRHALPRDDRCCTERHLRHSAQPPVHLEL